MISCRTWKIQRNNWQHWIWPHAHTHKFNKLYFYRVLKVYKGYKFGSKKDKLLRQDRDSNWMRCDEVANVKISIHRRHAASFCWIKFRYSDSNLDIPCKSLWHIRTYRFRYELIWLIMLLRYGIWMKAHFKQKLNCLDLNYCIFFTATNPFQIVLERLNTRCVVSHLKDI